MINYEEYIKTAREHQLDYNDKKGFDTKKVAYIEAKTLVFELHMLIEEFLKILILDSFMSGLLLKGDDFVEEMLDRISFYDKLQLAKKTKKKSMIKLSMR